MYILCAYVHVRMCAICVYMFIRSLVEVLRYAGLM